MQQLHYGFILSFFLLLTNNLVAQEAYVQKILDSLEKLRLPVQQAKLHNDLGFYFAKLDSWVTQYLHAGIAIII